MFTKSFQSPDKSTRVITNAAALVEIRGDVDTVVAAANYVENHECTPVDALHLVESNGDPIVSSDVAYEGFAPRVDLQSLNDE